MKMYKNKNIIASVLLFLICLLVAIFSGDRLPLIYKSFDVHSYLDMVQNFSIHFKNQDFVNYYNSRLLIPALASLLLNVINSTPTDHNIENLFLLFNVLSIFIAIIYYFKIAHFKKYTVQTTLLGFGILFFNFFSLKLTSFYPILMDFFGFTSGLMLLYYHLSNKKIKFFITLFVSMFVFPTTIIICLAFIGSQLIVFDDNKGLQISKHLKTYRIILLIPIILSLAVFTHHIYKHYEEKNTIQFSLELLPLSIICAIIILFFLLKRLLNLFNGFSLKFISIKKPYFIFSSLIILIFIFISKYLSLNYIGKSPLTVVIFIYVIYFQILSFPLKFAIVHFVYFGSFVWFALYFRKDMFIEATKSDNFQKLIFSAFLILILGSESRQFLQLFPFIVILLLNVLDKHTIKLKLVLGVFVFQIIWSRFWYSINNGSGFLGSQVQSKDFMHYPAQRFFQFIGPWLNLTNSIVYGIILLITYYIFTKIMSKFIFKM